MAEAEVTVEPQEKTDIEEGAVNPAFEQGETTADNPSGSDGPEELPPLTYIDFVPQCLGTQIEGKQPEFNNFGSVVEQANQWLLSMPQFTVYKCETLTFKLGQDFKLDNDQTLTHVSSNGKNHYIMVLRLWLIPRIDPALPTQQLGYITVLPDHSSGDLLGYLNSLAGRPVATGGTDALPSFDRLSETVEKLNKHLGVKPLPGKILSVETIVLKCQETNTPDKLDAEGTTWTEGGNNARMYVYGFRVFYVLGQPAYETIGFHDEAPELHQSSEAISLKVRFSGFTSLTDRAGKWLQKQQGVRVVNIQSLNVKLERRTGTGPWMLDPDVAGYTVSQSLQESRYCKIVRMTYVREQKLDNPSPYAAVALTSRIFAPVRLGGKGFETFSKTVLRVIKWLHATRLPVFACETVRYQVNAESEGPGFNEERADYMEHTYSGRYHLTCIRLYFPSVFQEPPEEIEDNVDVGYWGDWRCVIS